MQCFARLVRALLGPDSVSEDKCEAGAELRVLGVDVQIDADGYTCRPAPEKKARWCAMLKQALAANKLPPGEAQKISGACAESCLLAAADNGVSLRGLCALLQANSIGHANRCSTS